MAIGNANAQTPQSDPGRWKARQFEQLCQRETGKVILEDIVAKCKRTAASAKALSGRPCPPP